MSGTRGTIVTLGGGGFSMSDDGSSLIDDLLLDMTGAAKPKVCFIPTASGDADGYSTRFEDAFRGRATTSVLSLFCHEPWGYTDPTTLLDQDLIYVGGGSTANLLAVWRHHGLPDILRQAADSGVVLAGISAGMNCWFEASSTDSYGPLAPLADGLGFLSGGACPHYLGEEHRRASLQEWVARGEMPDTWAVDDYAALIWRDEKMQEAVAERPNRLVCQVVRDGESAKEELTQVRYLS